MSNGPTEFAPTPDTSDALLVGMAREGNRAAWGVLATRHYEALFRWLWRLCGRHEVAEDLAQDAFLRASTRLELFREGTHFRAWLFRIGHNLWANHCRSMARRKTAGLDAAVDKAEMSAVGDDPSVLLGQREEIERLKERLRDLPTDWREALLMRAEGELAFKDIAEIQGITEETARWRVFKARQRVNQGSTDMPAKMEKKG